MVKNVETYGIIKSKYGPVKLKSEYLELPVKKGLIDIPKPFTTTEMREWLGLPIKVDEKYVTPYLNYLLRKLLKEDIVCQIGKDNNEILWDIPKPVLITSFELDGNNPPNERTPWTPEDEFVIWHLKNIHHFTFKLIGQVVGRSEGACSKKYSDLIKQNYAPIISLKVEITHPKKSALQRWFKKLISKEVNVDE